MLHPPHPPGGPPLHARIPWTNLLIAAVFVAASARLFVLIDRHSVNVLFWDQWEIWEALFDDAGAWELFRWRHGPHRQGVGFWLTQIVADLSGWNTRAEAFMIGAVTCTSAAGALWLRVRLLGPLRWWDAALPILLLTPSQYGIFIHTPNVSHSALPLCLVLASAIIWTLRSRRTRMLAIVPLTFVAIHTGFAVFVGLVTPALLGAEAIRAAREMRQSNSTDRAAARTLWLALAALVVSLVSLAYFFVDYPPDSVDRPARSLLFYYRYVALMFANALGLKGIEGWPAIVGSVVLMGALATLALQIPALFGADPKRRAIARSIASLAGFTLAYCSATALGRSHFDLPGAQSSRYVPLVLPGLVAMYLYLQFLVEGASVESTDRGANPPAAANLAGHAVMGAVVIATLTATIPMREPEARFMRILSADKREWVASFRESRDISLANRTSGRWVHPADPEVIRLREKLQYLEDHQLNLFLPVESAE